MGQKVNPHGIRIGINSSWSTQWYANKKNFATYISQDDQIRKAIKKKHYQDAISKINITRTANEISIEIMSGKPGVIIGGRDAAGIEAIKKMVRKIVNKKPVNGEQAVEYKVNVSVLEVKKVDLDAQIAAESIAKQLEQRIAFRKAMRSVITRAVKAGAKGIKTKVSGRLDGVDIARSEGYSEGSIPLQTLRADIDYGFAEANTTYGIIGVKVWIYKGEIFDKKNKGGNN